MIIINIIHLFEEKRGLYRLKFIKLNIVKKLNQLLILVLIDEQKNK